MVFLQNILAKIVGAFAPIIVNKISKGLAKFMREWLDKRKSKKNKKQDEINANTYETTLQDSTNEQGQIDATLDVLNRNKRK